MSRVPKLLFLFFLAACGQTERNTNADTHKKIEKVFYVETKNFGADLQICFNNTLFSKWSDTSFTLHDNTIPYEGNDLKSKHVFLDVKSLTPTHTPLKGEKITVILKGDLTVENTTYSIERFTLQPDGQWKNVANDNNLNMSDRPNDVISPSELDVDEICEQIVKKVVESSFGKGTNR